MKKNYCILDNWPFTAVSHIRVNGVYVNYTSFKFCNKTKARNDLGFAQDQKESKPNLNFRLNNDDSLIFHYEKAYAP